MRAGGGRAARRAGRGGHRRHPPDGLSGRGQRRALRAGPGILHGAGRREQGAHAYRRDGRGPARRRAAACGAPRFDAAGFRPPDHRAAGLALVSRGRVDASADTADAGGPRRGPDRRGIRRGRGRGRHGQEIRRRGMPGCRVRLRAGPGRGRIAACAGHGAAAAGGQGAVLRRRNHGNDERAHRGGTGRAVRHGAAGHRAGRHC
ncbi:hypothetical protein FQZ97_834850 [compost metagenome]